jgi:hypothetical protein
VSSPHHNDSGVIEVKGLLIARQWPFSLFCCPLFLCLLSPFHPLADPSPSTCHHAVLSWCSPYFVICGAGITEHHCIWLSTGWDGVLWTFCLGCPQMQQPLELTVDCTKVAGPWLNILISIVFLHSNHNKLKWNLKHVTYIAQIGWETISCNMKNV